MSVEQFDPGAVVPVLDAQTIAQLLLAADQLDLPQFGLDPDAVTRLARLACHEGTCDWSAAAKKLTDEDVERLIRLYTLAEKLPGWEAGAKSPVIALAAALKERGVWPGDLTAWIRANTDNRFLPYGNLMDRL